MAITETLVSHAFLSTNITGPYDTTADTTPSGAANTILLAMVLTTGGQVDPSTVAGNGKTWTQIQAINRGTTIRLMLYIADGNGATSAIFNTTYAVAQTGQQIVVKEFKGIDTSGGITTVGAGKAIIQAPTGTGTTGTGTITMAAYAATDNREAAAFEHLANEANTAEAGWTMEANSSGSNSLPNQSLGFEHKLDAQDTSPTMTWTSSTVAWRGIAAELNALVGGAPADHGPAPRVVKQAVNRAAVF